MKFWMGNKIQLTCINQVSLVKCHDAHFLVCLVRKHTPAIPHLVGRFLQCPRWPLNSGLGFVDIVVRDIDEEKFLLYFYTYIAGSDQY